VGVDDADPDDPKPDGLSRENPTAGYARRPSTNQSVSHESAYQAGARQAGWDIEQLACPNGITDPQLRRHALAVSASSRKMNA
jgi:hypothetical protein